MAENANQIVDVEKNDEGESIPPVAQNIIVAIVSFMVHKGSLLIFFPVMLIIYFTFYSYSSWLSFGLIVLAGILYFHLRKKIIDNFKASLKNIRYKSEF